MTQVFDGSDKLLVVGVGVEVEQCVHLTLYVRCFLGDSYEFCPAQSLDDSREVATGERDGLHHLCQHADIVEVSDTRLIHLGVALCEYGYNSSGLLCFLYQSET